MNTSIVVTAIVSALTTWLFMYLDARLFDTPKSKLAYFKGMIFVAALSATIVYFMGSPSLPVLASGAAAAVGQQGTALVQGEEIFIGMPTF